MDKKRKEKGRNDNQNSPKHSFLHQKQASCLSCEFLEQLFFFAKLDQTVLERQTISNPVWSFISAKLKSYIIVPFPADIRFSTSDSLPLRTAL